MRKIYYRIPFKLTSPLAVGNGENLVTDKDIVRDCRGIPYVPATALAGVYRSVLDEEEADYYFGEKIKITNELKESKIVVYDATVLDVNKVWISKRDMVSLGEFKTAIDGAKFDFEVLEPGVEFLTYLEQNMNDREQDVSQKVVEEWIDGKIMLGAKTTRGYGHTSTIRENIQCAVFDLSDPESLRKWLDFNMYDTADDNWKQYVGSRNKMPDSNITVTLNLKQKGGISVRQYSSDIGQADYRQIKLGKVSNNVPVIPGTSWAGAFRHHMRKLGYHDQKQAFGFVEKLKKDSKKSLVFFSESQINGGEDIEYTRNAIDRFSGGTVDRALYSENTHYNGHTQLCITFDGKVGMTEFTQYLAAAIMDLNAGYMSVGGLTGIGRGIFEVKSIAVDTKILDEFDYHKIVQAIRNEVKRIE